MTPETAAVLRKASELLDEARLALSVSMIDHAGRAAYLAGFHAAQALISERTDRSIKTHRGVITTLHRLTKDEPRFDDRLRAFLGRTYQLKAIADYETGPGAHVTQEQAAAAIDGAQQFIAAVGALIDKP